MNKERRLLSKEECASLKGFAILAISFHNLCHSLPGAPQENEFWFSASNNLTFLNTLQMQYAIIQLFAFWGYLGVPIFVFLSGYGLTVKYNCSIRISWKHFVVSHYKKLIIPMIIGTVIYQILLFFLSQELNELGPLFLQISMLRNLLPHNIHFFPGPYWYFGMTLQLYVIFILLRCKTIRYVILVASAFLIVSFFLQSHFYLLVWIKYNSFGWLFPFAIGIYAGRTNIQYSYDKTFYSFILLLSFILTLIFSFQYHLWLLIPLIIPIFAICLAKTMPLFVQKPMVFIGDISLYIFVIHPIIRKLIITIGKDWNPYNILTIYIILTILIAFAAKGIVKLIKKRIVQPREKASSSMFS